MTINFLWCNIAEAVILMAYSWQPQHLYQTQEHHVRNSKQTQLWYTNRLYCLLCCPILSSVSHNTSLFVETYLMTLWQPDIHQLLVTSNEMRQVKKKSKYSLWLLWFWDMKQCFLKVLCKHVQRWKHSKAEWWNILDGEVQWCWIMKQCSIITIPKTSKVHIGSSI